jgi:hypothetical protein
MRSLGISWKEIMKNIRTLVRIQLALASAGILLARGGALWSWHIGDRHGLSLALLIIASAAVSVVFTPLVARTRLDHSA